MSKKAGLGIVGALAVGIALYFILKNKGSFSNINTTTPATTTPQNTTQKANITSPVIDNADLAPIITPQVVGFLNTVGISEGSSITNIIHGGTPCGYRGTNGKCYADKEEAERNGAA